MINVGLTLLAIWFTYKTIIKKKRNIYDNYASRHANKALSDFGLFVDKFNRDQSEETIKKLKQANTRILELTQIVKQLEAKNEGMKSAEANRNRINVTTSRLRYYNWHAKRKIEIEDREMGKLKIERLQEEIRRLKMKE